MPSGRIVVLGATGYTGRLTVERLVAAGAQPVLAGRSPEKLKRLAGTIGADLETVKADVMRQNSVFDLVSAGDVLVTTVGPFVKWGEPAVRAAIAAPCTYIDSTGEPEFIRSVWEDFGPAAGKAGATLMTAMGFDWVPGTLAGALAIEEAGDDAVRVDVGYYSLGGGSDSASEGTKASLVGATLAPHFAFRDGALQTERAAARVRTFPAKGKDRPAVSIGTAEHFSLPQAYPQLREVNGYLGWFGPLARPMQVATLATSMITKVPGTRTVLQAAGERLVTLSGAPEEGTTPGGISWIVAIAYDGDGDPLSEVHLQGPDGYEFTASFISWAARHAASAGVEATGAVGPVAAFGLEALRKGCAEAGLTRREPA